MESIYNHMLQILGCCTSCEDSFTDVLHRVGVFSITLDQCGLQTFKSTMEESKTSWCCLITQPISKVCLIFLKIIINK